MVQALTTELQSSIKILVGDTSSFTNRKEDTLTDLSLSTENAETNEYFESAQVTDQVIDFGKVVSPVFIYLKFISQADGNGANADGTHEPITIKVNTSTAITTDTLLLQTDDAINDTLPTTITWSSVANSTTKVTQVILGRSS